MEARNDESDYLSKERVGGYPSTPRGCQTCSRDDEVLIKVHSASINSRDWRRLRAKPFLIRQLDVGFMKSNNTILGMDLAGGVESAGRNVKELVPGDEVLRYLSEKKN